MQNESVTLEKAAKYICTTLDGQCPMAVERYVCPTACTVDTIPWRCWISFFAEQCADPRQADNPVEIAS